MRSLDDHGMYDAAVRAATGSGKANTLFASYESVSGDALAKRAKQLSDDLDRARLPLLPAAWLMLVAGVAAAIAARRGIAERLWEYR